MARPNFAFPAGVRTAYLRLCCLLFLGIFLVGVLIAAVLPPFQVPDENTHWSVGFYRVERVFSALSGGRPKCSPAYGLPQAFDLDQVAFKPGQKISPGPIERVKKLKRICAEPSLWYGGVVTHPGILLARLLVTEENRRPLSSLKVFFLSRIFHGFMLLGVLGRLLYLGFCSRTVPVGLLTLFAFCLSPLVLQESFSVSADLVGIVAAAAIVSAMIFWRRFGHFDWLVLVFFAFSASRTKPVYFSLILCAFLIAWLGDFILQRSCAAGDCDKAPATARARCYSAAAVVFSLGGVMTALWTDHTLPLTEQIGRRVNPYEQLLFALDNPLEVLGALYAELPSFFNLPVFVSPLGWLDLPLSGPAVSAWCNILLCAFSIDGILIIGEIWRGSAMTGPTRYAGLKWPIVPLALLSFSGFYVCAALVPLAMFLMWTHVGAAAVHGVQARHFLPMVIVLLGSLSVCAGAAVAGRNGRTGLAEKEEEFPASAFVRVGAAVLSAVFIVQTAFLTTHLYFDLVSRYW